MTVVFKFVLLIDLLLEFALYSIELYFYNRFRTRRILSNQKFNLSEKDRRNRYGVRYSIYNAIWVGICLLLILIVSLTTETQTCRIDQVQSDMNDLVCVDCAIDKCASCLYSGQDSCDTCETGFYRLENENNKIECINSAC